MSFLYQTREHKPPVPLTQVQVGAKVACLAALPRKCSVCSILRYSATHIQRVRCLCICRASSTIIARGRGSTTNQLEVAALWVGSGALSQRAQAARMDPCLVCDAMIDWPSKRQCNCHRSANSARIERSLCRHAAGCGQVMAV